MIIAAAPDYLPLSLLQLVGHFLFVLFPGSYARIQRYTHHTKILGFSCRALFHKMMKYFDRERKQNLVVVTTPFHHTSFRDIIELFVEPENIHIMKLNAECTRVESIPDITDCDLVIVTHMFGQDLDCSLLQDFKLRTNCIMIEDRVLGGTSAKVHGDEVFDISFYSAGMDKRPCALGGGFVCLKNVDKFETLTCFLEKQSDTCTEETSKDRFMFLLAKIPTYLLYNCKMIIHIFLRICRLLSLDLQHFLDYYRKNNSGFTGNNYSINPSNATIKSIHKSFNSIQEIESLYSKKSTLFLANFDNNFLIKFFPWYRQEPLLIPYNTISVGPELQEKLIAHFNSEYVPIYKNPTYKTFKHEYNGKTDDEAFLKSLLYLPSLANLTEKEIYDLANLVKGQLKEDCSNFSTNSTCQRLKFGNILGEFGTDRKRPGIN